MGTWKTSPIPTTALLLVVALVFVVVTPAAGIFEVNNFDWDKHRAVFLDLGREDWPVYFNTYYDSPVLLRYYLGYYIVPGLIGNLLGLAALTWAVPLWTWCGVSLALMVFAGEYRGWRALTSACILMLFGVIYMPFLALQATPIPDWNVLQLRFPLRDLVDSPQHFLSAMLYTLLFLQLRENRRFLAVSGIVTASSLFWSPFVTIGLLPFIGVMVFSQGVRPLLSWQNLLAAPPIALLIAAYLTSGANSIPHGWVWERFDWDTLFFEILRIPLVASAALLIALVVILRTDLGRDLMLLVALPALVVPLLYSYGGVFDWSHRVPLPALVVVAYFVAKAVLHRWEDYRDWYRRVALALLVIVIAAASVSGSARFLSFANAEHDFDVLRFESIERHDTVFSSLVPEFLPRFFVLSTGWQRLLLRSDGSDSVLDRGQVISESEFVIHLNNRTLVYVKRNCSEEEYGLWFILHVVPVDKSVIEGREHDNMDFPFAFNGARLGDTCIVTRDLPSYQIASFRTGQYTGGIRRTGEKWLVTHTMD